MDAMTEGGSLSLRLPPFVKRITITSGCHSEALWPSFCSQQSFALNGDQFVKVQHKNHMKQTANHSKWKLGANTSVARK
jgi:hypothetical protein